ncbi:hypothetical protein [Mycolicibacter kumamotonensis]|uniref:hypothetical protein n=1 Tax=Mycolicibacter kumamotonensis TaxID=354243 RepID=UPI00080662C9|nr:hypothetical protein [Mycolicibacter kumamotonensis]
MSFEPVHEVTYYQARCTECGVIEDDYGDYSAWSDAGTAIDNVCDNDWFAIYEPDGSTTVTGRPAQVLTKLLCPQCQHCEVCGNERAYAVDEHLVCEEHEDHEFTEDDE